MRFTSITGQIVINLAPEKVFPALVDSTHLKFVDQLYIDSKVCHQYDPEHVIVYYQFKWDPHVTLIRAPAQPLMS